MHGLMLGLMRGLMHKRGSPSGVGWTPKGESGRREDDRNLENKNPAEAGVISNLVDLTRIRTSKLGLPELLGPQFWLVSSSREIVCRRYCPGKMQRGDVLQTLLEAPF